MLSRRCHSERSEESGLSNGIASVPSGPWAVGVSGGADSVALLSLLRQRGDLQLCIAHLDHETRHGESGRDAEFVAQLARDWNIPLISRRRGEIEAAMEELPSNKSARFRAARLQFFRDVVRERNLQGIILAHHADDQAETVAQRLLRGANLLGLRGMTERATVGGLTILRPLLNVRREVLRNLLIRNDIPWREDQSNADMDQQRNRLRKLLARQADLTDHLLRLGRISGRWIDWASARAPVLGESYVTSDLDNVMQPLAELALRRWLAERIDHRADITPAAVTRLLQMATDAASPARQHFPGGLLVRRRSGRIFTETATSPGQSKAHSQVLGKAQNSSPSASPAPPQQ